MNPVDPSGECGQMLIEPEGMTHLREQVRLVEQREGGDSAQSQPKDEDREPDADRVDLAASFEGIHHRVMPRQPVEWKAMPGRKK